MVYQASQKKNNWNKEECTAYMTACGIGPEITSSLYTVSRAIAMTKENTAINYGSDEGVAGYQFPSAWLNKDLSLREYIEAIMHILLLGCTKSNLELISTWLSEQKGSSPFSKVVQQLIIDLRPFNLSWLAAVPLTGKKGELGYGSWVSENWSFFVRVSPILFGWHKLTAGKKGPKGGVDDMQRMVVAFHAFVARCLTHNGIDDAFIAETHLYLNEFLSSVREFDIRVRKGKYDNTEKAEKKDKARADKIEEKSKKGGPRKKKRKKIDKDNDEAMKAAATNVEEEGDEEEDVIILDATATNSKKKKSNKKIREPEAWWLKANYMSLVNLITMMTVIGPLVLWWDGGGKGEKFIQMVKPHIKKGIREDILHFFVKLMDKLFRVKQVELFDRRFGLSVDQYSDGNSAALVLEVLFEVANVLLPNSDDDNRDDESTASGDEKEPMPPDAADRDAHFSTSETLGMTKKRTIYAYRNEEQLNKAIAAKKPIAGIIQMPTDTSFEFLIVYRKTGKHFARRRVLFADDDGVSINGLWCAKIQIEEEESCPSTGSFSDIQSDAVLSAVIIPLWYVLDKDHQDAYKYCVVTNFWKVRQKDGWYRLPTLDPAHYGDSYCDGSTDGDVLGASGPTTDQAFETFMSEQTSKRSKVDDEAGDEHQTASL